MKDKASKKTEDEVLDQTFGGSQTFDGFDEEMTAHADGTKAGSGTPEKKKSSGSNNTLLFVAGGVAAVGILGYMFVLKPIISTTPVPAKPPQQSVIPEQAPVSPTAPVDPVVPVVPSDGKVATDFLTGNVSVQSTPVPVTLPVVVPVAPVIITLPVIPEASASNVTSSEGVKELVRKFDLQGGRFRIALDEVANKVNGLEKFRDNQLGVNKNVDERLTRLEGGKVVKVTITPEMLASTDTATVVKKSPLKASKSVREVKASKSVREVKASKSVREVKEPRDYRNVIVDKTEDRSPRDTKAKEPVADYNIHSIYGGRVWLKNSDGSLSTYISGDRLPSGELIKSVDDEKYLINTDKRSFSKK